MYHVCIHLSVNGHLGCLHVLAIVNSTSRGAWILLKNVFLQIYAQGYMVVLILPFFFLDEPLCMCVCVYVCVCVCVCVCLCSVVSDSLQPYSSPYWLYQLTFPPAQ